ncbi:MAG TPA: hypothetical protein VFP10_07500 [Candidatus Eisenbacteria bacterium]|nr:hypothetical protein [Candidatus Eisenbacteria bacterium]
MMLRSALRRLAVTVPFFLVATAIMRVIAGPLDISGPRSVPVVLIVTTERLHSPFRALELWNGSQGCQARLVTLGDPRGANLAERLSGLCRDQGATDLLLGGDEELIPLLARADEGVGGPAYKDGAPRVFTVPARGVVPAGVRVSRAPVRDVGEAWAFVEACRTSGQTLDRLLAEPVAVRPDPEERALAEGLIPLSLP